LNPEVGGGRQPVFQYTLLIPYSQAMMESKPGQSDTPAEVIKTKRSFVEKID
jgi:hypothetical protein